jgi:putative lipoic acid-binding regulatory protein
MRLRFGSNERFADVADESLLSFPCELPVKVFGRNEPHFLPTVVEIVSGCIDAFDESRISTHESREGRFLSITITVRAESREQADELYRRLTSNEHVLMAL